MIRRNLYFAPKSVKNKAYIAIVRPIMEFASICWDPFHENLLKKVLRKCKTKLQDFCQICTPYRTVNKLFCYRNCKKIRLGIT